MNKQHLEMLTNIIGAVESGGQIYGKRRYEAYAGAYTNTQKEVTCTLGWAQNYGNEGRKLLRMILESDMDAFRNADTAKIEQKLQVDWVASKWNPTEKEKKALIAIITTPAGKKCQDKLFSELMQKYEQKALEYGIPESNVPAIMMWCEIEHLGGLIPTKRIFNRCGNNPSVDEIFNALLKDQADTTNNNQVGDKKFQSRHECCARWIKYYVGNGKQEEKKMGYDVNKLLDIARAEIGYCEKKSNSQLEDKTANAGSGNFTKYWRDMKPSWNGSAWCDCFVDWCFTKAYGSSAAQALECGGCGEYYTPTSAQYYKDNGQWSKIPKVGSQIFFKNSTRIHHTGIVESFTDTTVTTIEGNTSNGSKVVPNGGMVCRKTYKRSLSSIAGYGHPEYGIADQKEEDGSSTTDLSKLNATQKWVGEVTTALNVRIGPGTEYKNSKYYPKLEKGNLVGVCDYIKNAKGEIWYYIKISNAVVKARAGKDSIYDFVKAEYIKKI